MTVETIDFCDNSFMAVAVRHGLLQRRHVEKIVSHANQSGVQPSDAALTLSMLEFHEVDAINLLCRPADLASGYTLKGLIGCGAGGLVFRAHQTAMDREVALKTINVRSLNASTTGLSRLQRESLAIARLHHPNIVAAFDSGCHQGRFCMAMELVEGETLADLIARESTVPESVAWQIARQVASALAHANDAGITHRDIKPANLLLCETPQGTSLPAGVPFVKVADFGLALQSSTDGDSFLTATGTTLGTPAYVAPEQLHDTHVDARADIYSLGATVYHMLTGLAPCADRSPMRTIMQKTIGDDRWRNEVPASLSAETVALFRDMTETDPDQRIGDYRQLIDRIDDCLGGSVRRSAAPVPAKREANGGPLAKSFVRSLARPLAKSLGGRRTVRSVVSALVLAMGVGTFALGWAVRTGATSETFESTSQWTINGLSHPLFQGTSVPLFRQSGGWATGIAGDGSGVLIGQEGAQMTIPLRLPSGSSGSSGSSGDRTRDLRLRVGVLYSPNRVAEIAVLASDGEIELAVLRFDHDSVAFTPDTATANRWRSRESRTIDLPTASTDDSVFQRVSLWRQGDQILVRVNGEEIGRVACREDLAGYVRLRCVENASSFADIDVAPITRAAGDAS